MRDVLISEDTKASTKTSSIVSSIWASTLTEWSRHSTSLALTAWTAKTTNSRRHIWEISLLASLASREAEHTATT
mgnify:CR=1 FL=1